MTDISQRESGAADCLSLAAAPTFALMALLDAVFNGGSAMHGHEGSVGWLIGDMALMYLLMSIFHATPWLNLLSGYRASFRSRSEAHSGQ